MRTRLRTFLPAAALGLTTCIAVSAHAQSFGRQGDVSFSAERVMGLYLFHEGGDDATIFSFGAPTPGAHPYTNARLGVDGFVVDHLSLGGSLAFWGYDPHHGGSTTGFLFAPRIGYAIPFSASVGFWPRAGVTYRTFGGDNEVALTLEGQFYAAPTSHFAFTFGPVIDLGLAGSGEEARNFGVLTAGILGWI